MSDMPTFVGLTIEAAEETDDGHLWLRFTDGTVLEIGGRGYDDAVDWTWHESKGTNADS